MLTRATVEDAIVDLCDRLEAMTDEYADACDELADAEIEWKAASDHTVLVARYPDGRTPSIADRERHARDRHAPKWERYVRAKARLDVLRTALGVHRSRLDALRTLSASVREQT